jgi:hypothetical protein
VRVVTSSGSILTSDLRSPRDVASVVGAILQPVSLCGNHCFKSAVQFNTTVVGDVVWALTTEVTRKRWPSLVAA